MKQTPETQNIKMTSSTFFTPLIKGIAYALGTTMLALFGWLFSTTMQTDQAIRVMQAGLVQHERAYEREFQQIHSEFSLMQENISGLREDLKFIINRKEIADAS